MAKTLRILSFLFLGIGLTALIYWAVTGRQPGNVYTWLPFLLSSVCSLSYHGMTKQEQGSRRATKTDPIIGLAGCALVVVVLVVIVLN